MTNDKLPVTTDYTMRLLPKLLPVLLLLLGCQGNPQPEHRLTGKPIDEVLEENRPHLMTIQGVVGTSIGECGGNPCIKVLVEKKTAILQQQIPSMLETWQVEIVEAPNKL